MNTPRRVPYSSAKCPECHGNHDYYLRVATAIKPVAGVASGSVLVFGGKDPETPTTQSWDVQLICPMTGRSYSKTVHVPISEGESAVSVTQEVDEQHSPVIDWRTEEFSEWIKASIANERDFCKTMLSTASGAIPVYFAVLKYLGIDHVFLGWKAFSVGPPALFFAAMLAFSVPLRPVGRLIKDLSDFAAFRDRRLTSLALGIRFGMLFFAVALLWSVALWLVLLAG